MAKLSIFYVFPITINNFDLIKYKRTRNNVIFICKHRAGTFNTS